MKNWMISSWLFRWNLSSVDILAISTVGLRLQNVTKSRNLEDVQNANFRYVLYTTPRPDIRAARPDLISHTWTDFARFLPFTISSIKWPVIVSVTHLVFIRSSLNINTTAIEKITNYLIFATSLLSHQLTNFMTDSPVTWKPPSQHHDFGKITKPKSILAT